MGYQHIQNLYKDQTILLFRECYALEKIHGTSAGMTFGGIHDGTHPPHQLHLHPGGETDERFNALFDLEELRRRFIKLGHPGVRVFGEAYGGKQQRQSWRYGPDLRFVVFEVQIGGLWLATPQAEDVAGKLGLEFVHYVKCSTDLAALDAERDAPSEQARRNGIDGDKPREGVVLRPLIEVTTNNGSRIIAKHKRDEERETRSKRKVGAPPEVIQQAESVALEWVTQRRLEHVLQKMPPDTNIQQTKAVIDAMTEDVVREGAGEFVDSREARVAIGRRTATLFKAHLNDALRRRTPHER